MYCTNYLSKCVAAAVLLCSVLVFTVAQCVNIRLQFWWRTAIQRQILPWTRTLITVDSKDGFFMCIARGSTAPLKLVHAQI